MDPLSTNFLFISSFSFRRARISALCFRLVFSFLLFISAISFCRDIKSTICSASNIFSFILLLVGTIYFLLHVNYSRTRLELRERFDHSFGQSVSSSSLPPKTNSSLLFRCSTPRLRELQARMAPAKDTLTLK